PMTWLIPCGALRGGRRRPPPPAAQVHPLLRRTNERLVLPPPPHARASFVLHAPARGDPALSQTCAPRAAPPGRGSRSRGGGHRRGRCPPAAPRPPGSRARRGRAWGGVRCGPPRWREIRPRGLEVRGRHTLLPHRVGRGR